ncbi:MAG: hypothetical protein R3C25_10010 [Hyphomonadaceae bacterium]
MTTKNIETDGLSDAIYRAVFQHARTGLEREGLKRVARLTLSEEELLLLADEVRLRTHQLSDEEWLFRPQFWGR